MYTIAVKNSHGDGLLLQAKRLGLPTTAGSLRPSHGYGVTAIKRVTLTGSPVMRLVGKEKINMIRLRDPWSNGSWSGTFGHEYVWLLTSMCFTTRSDLPCW